MAAIDSAEASEQARFAIELYAVGALNLLAAIGLLVRQSGRGLWLALGMQAATLVWALIEGVAIDPHDQPGWFFFSTLPLLTFIVLLALRKSQAVLSTRTITSQP
jgi:peptidoglycan/LPS O-acetylase OafA/YrhL